MRRKGQQIDLSKVNKVVVVRLDEIGDMVMTVPFLRELRRNLPGAWITLVVTPTNNNLVEFCPYVNEVLTYECNGAQVRRGLRYHVRALKLAYKALLRRRFDLAIVPRWDVDYYHASFVAYFSGAPWRLGYSEKVTGEKQRLNAGFDGLYTKLIHDDTIKHEVERCLDLLRSLGRKVKDDRLELWSSLDDDSFAEQIMKSDGVQAGDLVVAFAPGAGEPKRKWPLLSFIELGDFLINEHNARIIVLGGRGEGPLGREIRQRLGNKVSDMVEKTTLRQAGALMKHCSLFVGNDAGTLHLAAAADIPVIEISCHPKFGSPSHANSPLRFGPWGVPHAVLQPQKAIAPCSDSCDAELPHCITGVKVNQVKEAVASQLRTKTETAWT